MTTMSDDKRYEATKCMYCGNQDLVAGDFEEVDNIEAARRVWCNTCQKEYWEVYKYSHQEAIEEG